MLFPFTSILELDASLVAKAALCRASVEFDPRCKRISHIARPQLSLSLFPKPQSKANPDNMAEKSTPIRASCHCGAITVLVPRLPDHINHCQCTICRRYGAAWGYYHPDEVKIETKPNAVTKQYIWGDRETSFNFCDTCGCV